jgi:exopolyphosphatase/guanosine-5'-triphosphate,3'-diphosphate pyrophosphatase
LKDFFNREIGSALEARLGRTAGGQVCLVGTGGTASILARMEKKLNRFDREAIEGTRLSRQRVFETMVDLWSKPLVARKQIIGLPANRADVILMGVGIYEAVMDHFGLEELCVSTRGLRFGAILDGG